MQFWTESQWVAFIGVTTAGVGALMLLLLALGTIRSWATPAPLRLVPAHAAHFSSRPAPGVLTMHAWQDPMKADYTDPGSGALTSVLAVEADPALLTERERQAAEDAWVHAYATITDDMLPETLAAAETLRINIEPAMRTARLWLMRAGEVGARAALASWRMDTPTGEYLSPYSPEHRAMVTALLIS